MKDKEIIKKIRYYLRLTWMYPVMFFSYLMSPGYREYRYFHGDLWEEIKKAQRKDLGI